MRVTSQTAEGRESVGVAVTAADRRSGVGRREYADMALCVLSSHA